MNRRSPSIPVAALVAVMLAGGAVATTDAVSLDGDDRSALYEYRHGNDPPVGRHRRRPAR